jgi:O-antigen/teichoic acid export membrane protein
VNVSLWKRILQGLVAYSGTAMIVNLSGALQAVFTLRYLAVAEFGALSFVLSIFSIAAILIDLGTSSMMAAEIAKARGAEDKPRVRVLISVYGRMVLGTGTILCLVFFGIARYRQDILWAIMGLHLLLSALNLVPHTLFLSHTRYRRSAAVAVMRSTSRLALLATLPWWAGGERLTGVALTYPLMEVSTLLLSLWMVRPIWRELRGLSGGQANLAALMRRQGVYVILAVPLKQVSEELPVWLLKALAGDVAVGLFGAARKAMYMAYAVFGPLETILLPLVSELVVQGTERARIVLRQAQKYAFWVSVIFVLACIPLAPWLVLFIGGVRYVGTTPVLQWALIHLVAMTFAETQRPVFYAIGEERWMLLIYAVGIMAYAPLLWAGIRWAGALGAAQAMVGYGVLLATIRLVVLRRLSPDLWVSPLQVFAVDAVDRELLRRVRLRLRHIISARESDVP